MAGRSSRWTERQDGEGFAYFEDTATGETRWAIDDWTPQWDEDGNKYYLNTLTEETRWELPAPAPQASGTL